MNQQIIAFTIVILAASYLVYKWKLQKIIFQKLKKPLSSSCASGCGSCPSARKVKKFS
jgi:hypothetical protein